VLACFKHAFGVDCLWLERGGFMLRQHLWIGAIAVGLISGCEKKEEPNVDVSPSRPAEPAVDTRNTDTNPNNNNGPARTGEPSVQQGGVSPQAAVQSIVQSRCSREARCNNIGADRKYSSMTECTSKLTEKRSDDMNLSDCPRGISQKELDECLAEIRNEDCNNPLDSLGRLAACRSSDLCMSAP
jgi:hypothetical protein